MTNAHVKTAADNLQRAATDMRGEEQQLKNEMTTMKQQSLTSIKALRTQLQQLEGRKASLTSNLDEKRAIDRQQQTIRKEIAEIEKNTKMHEETVNQQIRDMENAESEFKSLSSRLDQIA